MSECVRRVQIQVTYFFLWSCNNLVKSLNEIIFLNAPIQVFEWSVRQSLVEVRRGSGLRRRQRRVGGRLQSGLSQGLLPLLERPGRGQFHSLFSFPNNGQISLQFGTKQWMHAEQQEPYRHYTESHRPFTVHSLVLSYRPYRQAREAGIFTD